MYVGPYGQVTEFYLFTTKMFNKFPFSATFLNKVNIEIEQLDPRIKNRLHFIIFIL